MRAGSPAVAESLAVAACVLHVLAAICVHVQEDVVSEAAMGFPFLCLPWDALCDIKDL